MNYKYRILIFDEDPHDRGLLSLALRNAEPALELLEASSALEIAHHVSRGPLDALIVDETDASFHEIARLAAELRRQTPLAVLWLFTASPDLPSARECIGLGVDGRTTKSSAGFLGLPRALLDRISGMRTLRERYQTEVEAVFADSFGLPACLVGEGGVLRLANPALEAVLDLPRYALLDLPLERLMAEADEKSAWRGRFERANAKVSGAVHLQLEGGRVVSLAMTGRAVEVNPGEPPLWAVCFLEAGPSRGAAGTGAPPAAQDPEGLLYAIAHDLQAPLNSLASHTRTLQGGKTIKDAEAREAVDEIGALADRMQRMLDGILQVATAGGGADEREMTAMDDVLEDALNNLHSEIEQAGATLERQPLPSLRINRGQLTQVIQNLLANAVKFRGDRIPRVYVYAEETPEALRLVVEDNGIGIEARDVERIFGMFQRLHTEREYPGLGVGLALCRRIIRAHGGELSVDSRPGRGSKFIMTFPASAWPTLRPANDGPHGGKAE